MNIKLLLTAILFISQFQLQGQNGFLDTTFAGPAKGYKIFNEFSSGTRVMAVDAKGRIVIAINSSNRIDMNYNDTIFVVRLKPDGMRDYPFGAGDTIAYITDTTLITAKCMTIQPDGKILVGGFRQFQDRDGGDMMVVRLHENGTLDTRFGKDGFWVLDRTTPELYTDDAVTNIGLQSNGNIVVVGHLYDFDNNTTLPIPTRIHVRALTVEGREDLRFKKFESVHGFNENVTGLAIHKDFIYVGGDYQTYQEEAFYTVVKLFPLGDTASEGNWKNGRVDISLSSYINSGYGGIVVQPDGDIFIGGSAPNIGFQLVRINQNGFEDPIHQYDNPLRPLLTDILVDSEGKLVLSGFVSDANYNNNSFISVVNEYGVFDQTFGVNGSLSIPSAFRSNLFMTPRASALSKDHKLLLAGETIYTDPINGASTYFPSIIKVHLDPVMHIVGSNFVLPNSAEIFSVKVPVEWENYYSFEWQYSDKSVPFIGGSSGSSIELFFRESSENNGILRCSAYDANGTLFTSIIKKITINRNPTVVDQLDKLDCPVNPNSCSAGFIDYFKFNLIRNDSSGCSSNGYTDYTRSSMVDTLIVGGVYSASFRVDNPGAYVGIWIDYNNDGVFNTSDEFVAEQYNESSRYIQIQNIILKNEAGYFGPKRMRVRSRSNGAFSSGESCQSAEDIGETEDYLVVLVKPDELAAPQIITPNDDGKNDYFVIRGVKPDLKNKLIVFDRMGEVKFSAEDYENNWNGMSKGKLLMPGTYYYLFTNDGKSIRGFLEIRY